VNVELIRNAQAAARAAIASKQRKALVCVHRGFLSPESIDRIQQWHEAQYTGSLVLEAPEGAEVEVTIFGENAEEIAERASVHVIYTPRGENHEAAD
jgi:hypothetical protein